MKYPKTTKKYKCPKCGNNELEIWAFEISKDYAEPVYVCNECYDFYGIDELETFKYT